MSNTFTFEFDELPLVIHNGIPAAMINGCAEIEYNREGFVGIDGVCIEGYQNLTPEERARGVKPWIYVPAPVDIEITIIQRLEREWSGRVQDAITEQLASDREYEDDRRADYRRERYA